MPAQCPAKFGGCQRGLKVGQSIRIELREKLLGLGPDLVVRIAHAARNALDAEIVIPGAERLHDGQPYGRDGFRALDSDQHAASRRVLYPSKREGHHTAHIGGFLFAHGSGELVDYDRVALARGQCFARGNTHGNVDIIESAADRVRGVGRVDLAQRLYCRNANSGIRIANADSKCLNRAHVIGGADLAQRGQRRRPHCGITTLMAQRGEQAAHDGAVLAAQ